MLYLFAGIARDGDIRSHLQKICASQQLVLTMHEFDLVRGPDQDLSSTVLWDNLFKMIQTGVFDVLILSPPCSTFSRARHRYSGTFGPRPLRSHAHLLGFPWLRDADNRRVEQANFFIRQSFKAARLQQQQGLYFILEHPEDLGRVSSGERPASIWAFDEILEMCAGGDIACWGVHQCFFGAATSKPTRLLSNLPAALRFGVSLPVFDDDGRYLGRCRNARMHMTSVPAGTPMAPGAQRLQLLILQSFPNSWLAFASVPSTKYRQWPARTAFLPNYLRRLRPLLQSV